MITATFYHSVIQLNLDARGTSGCRCAIVPMLRQQKGRSRNKASSPQVFSLAARSRLVSMREKNMRQNHIQSKNAKLFRKLLTAIQTTRGSLLAAVALGMAASASLSPGTAYAQEYPWCLSRESYLYCFYETQEQCQWTASGIGGCALNPRLLFPNKPRDSRPKAISRSKTY
jgi:hypothetical protein